MSEENLFKLLCKADRFLNLILVAECVAMAILPFMLIVEALKYVGHQ